MTEVFKSEAIHILPALVWTVFVVCVLLGLSLSLGALAYTNNTSFIPSGLAAGVAVVFFIRAKKYYMQLIRYIHFPPNCKIIDTHSLTSDD